MNIYRKVSEIMSTQLITVSPYAKVTEIAAIFEEHNIHHIPVVGPWQKVIGMISRHDFYRLEHPQTKNGFEFAEAANKQLHEALFVKDVMTHDVVCIEKDVPILDVLNMFLKNRFHSVIIIDKDACIGIVTPYDILKELKKLSVVLQ